tara:strand:+ start:1091 stop:2233 length:1143 start_codon:yes stop_codon:yes gene_type:complete
MSKSQIPTGGIADDAVSTAKVLNDSRIVTPLIINGDMAVAQRATSTTGIGSDTAFVCDRWAYRKGGSPSFRATISQNTTVPTGQGFLTSLKVDCTTAQTSLSAGDRFGIDQKIEAQNLVNLKQGTSSADKTTLAFWVRSNLTGQFNIWIYKPDNTVRSFVKAYTISSADTWEKKIINIPADTDSGAPVANDNGEGWRITWMLAAGSTFSSGSIATSWENYSNANIGVSQTNFGSSTDNEFYLTGVQLEVGEFDSDTIPPFPFESFSSNLHKCRRYFQKSPKTDGLNHYALHDMFAYDNNNCFAGYIFNPPMRDAPSISQTTAAEFLTNGTDKSITTDMLYSSQKDNETARIRFYDGNAFSSQNGKVGILQNGTFKFESEL